MSPRAILFVLAGAACGVGGISQGLFWRNTLARSAGPADAAKLEAARKEIDLLKRENVSLRSLAQGGGEVAVTPEVIHAVEQEFGMRFTSNPVIHSGTAMEIRERAEAAIESSWGPSGADDRQEAWRMLGWIGAEGTLVAQLAAAATALSPGWFDETTGDAWMSDRWDSEAIPDQAELRRLLARILLHQHFPPPREHLGDEAARARMALHEGAALGVKQRFLSGHALKGFLSTKENNQGNLVFSSLPPFVRGLWEFSNAGKGYADQLHMNGGDALRAALGNPPQSTAEIFGESTINSVLLPEFPERPFLIESAGVLGLRLWLEGDLAAADWRGDRYALVPDQGATRVIWEIEAKDEPSTNRLENAARARISKSKGVSLILERVSPTRIRVSSTAAAGLRSAPGDEDSGG